MTDTYSTADLNRMLAEELSRKQRQPVRSSFFGGVVPQVPAQEAAQNRSDIEAQRGQPGVISKLLIGGAANAADAVGMPGVFDPSGDIRNQTWGNALRASSWIPQDTIEGVGQAITAPRRTYEGELTPKGGVYQDDSGAYVDEIGKPLSAYRDEMISEGLNVAGNMAIGGSVVPKPSNAAGMFGGRLTGSAENAGVARSLDTDIARQIHDAQRAANPAADPNRLAQIAKRPSDDHPFLQDARGHRGNEWEVSSPVGNIIAYEGPQGVQIKGAGLDEGVPKGMGYGMPLYETLANEAAAAGKPVASDQIVSRPAQNVYGAMSRRGYDVQGPPSNALRHPDSGSLIANEPIYSVSAPNVAPRDMPPPLPDNALYANSKSSGVPGAMIAEASKRVEHPIKAYHGSPHDFDRFDLSRIGTGEGAQAFGHGLYFAENEGVAKSYRDTVQPKNAPLGQNVAAGYLDWHGDKGKAIRAIKTEIAKAGPLDSPKELLAALSHLENDTAVRPTGKMYEVSINASPDDFLDWDRPLSQQSEKVRGAASKAWGIPIEQLHDELFARKVPADISQKLRDEGVAGVRYLDQGSRTAGEGSRNYVVFDDQLIDIIRKYMNPQTAIAPGALMVEGAKDGRRQ